jgi:hypothetical protein
MQPFGHGADAAGLVDRDKRTDEVQIDHGQDIQRLYIRIKYLSIGFIGGCTQIPEQNDAVGRAHYARSPSAL